jgi:hypothetical protein
MSAGENLIEWNGTDRGGSTVASGLYFYRVETEEYNTTKKMLLLK